MGTAHRGYVTKYFSATGSSEEISVSGVVTVSIVNTGSFIGTIQLQRNILGATGAHATSFFVVEEGEWTNAYFPITKQIFESHPGEKLKLVCTAYTSGSCLGSIASAVMD